MEGIGRRKRRARSRRRREAGRGEEAGGGERGERREGGKGERRRKALIMICPHLDKKINKERVSIQLGIWVESSQLLF